LNQEGTFRSNCMDCLDRTNVIQSLLARRSLQSQLQVELRTYGILEVNTIIQITQQQKMSHNGKTLQFTVKLFSSSTVVIRRFQLLSSSNIPSKLIHAVVKYNMLNVAVWRPSRG